MAWRWAPVWVWFLLFAAAAQRPPDGLRTMLTDLVSCGDKCISGRVQLMRNTSSTTTTNGTNSSTSGTTTTSGGSDDSIDVCDDPKRPTWEQDEAVLACQGLGTFTDASSGYGRHFISTQSVVEVDCHGGEATLSSCSMRYRDGRSPCVAVVLTCHGLAAAQVSKKRSMMTYMAGIVALLCIVLGLGLVGLLIYLRGKKKAAAEAQRAAGAAVTPALPSFSAALAGKGPAPGTMGATSRPTYMEVLRQHSANSNNSGVGKGAAGSSSKLRAPAQAS